MEARSSSSRLLGPEVQLLVELGGVLLLLLLLLDGEGDSEPETFPEVEALGTTTGCELFVDV